MKAYTFTIILTSCIVYTYERKSIGKLTDLGAVTNFEGIESFYQILLREKAESPPQESKQLEKNIYIKKAICKNIFTSNYFYDVQREDWVDLDVKENRIELKNGYPDLFKFIYKERRTLCLSFISDSCYAYKYENNYRMLPVTVGGLKGDEYLFMCLVRDRQLRKIKPYFVSQEYNVNAFRNNYPMAARFIFGYPTYRNGTRTNQLKIQAMAEEAAVGWDFLSRFIEMYYVNERSSDKPRSSNRRKNTIRPAEGNTSWNDGVKNRSNSFDLERSRADHDSENTWNGGVKNHSNSYDIERPRTGHDSGNKWNVGVNNRSNSFDVERSRTGYNGENTDVMMPGHIVSGAEYASEPQDRRNRDDTNNTNQQLWSSNGREPLNNVNNEVWKNNRGNTQVMNRPLSAAGSWAPSQSNIGTMREVYDSQDPICQLTDGEKLRLCATIFASSVFKGKVKFVPSIENVQLECERKQITLIAEVAAPPPLLARITQWELRENGRKTYEESMIGCRGMTLDKNYKMTYLVSQGNYDNSVFVYTHKFSDRRVFVYNYFNNTSVI